MADQGDQKKKAADDLAQLTAKPVPTMADEVEEFEEKQRDYQAMYGAGGHFKEQIETVVGKMRGERAVEEVEEIPTEPEVERKLEREGYIEKVEKAVELKKPIVDDYTQQILLGSANPQKPQVVLPLTEEEIQKGLHHKVWEGIRWLAEWCVRQIKKLHGMVMYKS